jgi:hypothetical protein
MGILFVWNELTWKLSKVDGSWNGYFFQLAYFT